VILIIGDGERQPLSRPADGRGERQGRDQQATINYEEDGFGRFVGRPRSSTSNSAVAALLDSGEYVLTDRVVPILEEIAPGTVRREIAFSIDHDAKEIDFLES
jgi:hypothetical protein